MHGAVLWQEGVTDWGAAMYDREKICSTLRQTGFDADSYWVVAGAAMVLHGVKACTRDIDLGCSRKLADQLQRAGYSTEVYEDGSRRIQYHLDIEIFEEWRAGELEVLDGISVVSLKGIIMMKQRLGREKDMEDIRLICKYIEMKGGSYGTFFKHWK